VELEKKVRDLESAAHDPKTLYIKRHGIITMEAREAMSVLVARNGTSFNKAYVDVATAWKLAAHQIKGEEGAPEDQLPPGVADAAKRCAAAEAELSDQLLVAVSAHEAPASARQEQLDEELGAAAPAGASSAAPTRRARQSQSQRTEPRFHDGEGEGSAQGQARKRSSSKGKEAAAPSSKGKEVMEDVEPSQQKVRRVSERSTKGKARKG